MDLAGNTILITGGSRGIGLELARALVQNNTVIICGRSEEKLAQARAALPQLVTHVCDVTDEGQRGDMVGSVLRAHPELDVLINNAGGRRRVDLLSGEGADAALHYDVALNFTAPAALCTKLLGHLKTRPRASIVNISTGLVYLPKVFQTFYCAAKAALHSYTQSLRWALRGTRVSVHEALMTLVDTEFHEGQLPTTIRPMSAERAAELTLEGVRKGRDEIYIGKASLARWLSFVMPSKGMDIINR